MKAVFLLFLGFSFPTFAQEPHVEFDQEHEMKCHQELKHLGCMDKNEEQDMVCADSKAKQLSSDCQSLHKEKKKWKKNSDRVPTSQE